MKRMLYLISCILMIAVLGTFSLAAETIEGTCGYDVEFIIDTYTGEMTIFGSGIIDNPNEWQSYADTIVSVVIERGIIGIEEGVFSFLGALESVTIPNTLTTIHEYAFSECSSLNDIVIPDSVTYIGEYAFDGCTSLENTVDGVVYIKTTTNPYFMVTNITDWSISSFDIPEETRFVSEYAIQLLPLTEVTAINVAEGNLCYSSVDGVLFNKNKSKLVCYPSGKAGDVYTVPSGVTSIGNLAFIDCIELKTIVIADSVTAIGEDAFYGSGISSITIPSGVATIDGSAFSECKNLTEILVSETSTHFMDENGVLYNKDKSELVRFPENHSATSFSIPDGVEKIGNFAFGFCSKLTNLEIPSGVTEIGEYSFVKCGGLKEITLPTSVTAIGAYAFHDCISIIEFVIPDGVSYINRGTFWGCDSLTKVTIPDTVTKMESYAFSDCVKLDCVKLPAQLTTLGSYAFEGCTSLSSITIPSGVNSIYRSAFENCTSLKNVVISEGVKSISSLAFSKCTGLASVTIPSSITSISSLAFLDCTSDITIRCYKNSAADTYAARSGFNVVYLDDITEPAEGDIDGDGFVAVSDVLVSIQAVLNGTALEGADMNGDGEVTLIDIIRILKATVAV